MLLTLGFSFYTMIYFTNLTHFVMSVLILQLSNSTKSFNIFLQVMISRHHSFLLLFSEIFLVHTLWFRHFKYDAQDWHKFLISNIAGRLLQIFYMANTCLYIQLHWLWVWTFSTLWHYLLSVSDWLQSSHVYKIHKCFSARSFLTLFSLQLQTFR